VPQPRAQADPFQQGPRLGCGLRVSGQFQRQHHILQRGHLRQQLEGLEHEAHVARAPGGPRVFVELEQAAARGQHPALAGQVESRHQPEQGRLARTRRTHDRDRRPLADLEGHVVEDGEGAVRVADTLGEMLDDNR